MMRHRVRNLISQAVGQFARGDGCSLFEDCEFDVTLQHPWMVGAPLFVPESWVPTYDYPLICYLHDDGRSEQALQDWFPAISDQNYLALGLRAPFPAHSQMPGQYRWHGQRPDATAAVLYDTLEQVMREWNVHPDRIYLMGEGHGAVAALQQFLLSQTHDSAQHVTFRGAICRNLPGWWTRTLPPIPEPAHGRILFLDPVSDDHGEVPAVIDCLNESGIAVTVARESEPSHARCINHWIMSGIGTAIC